MAVNENTPTGSRGVRRITTTALASAAVIALLSGFGAVAFSDAPVPANAKIVGVHKQDGYADLVEAVKPAVVNVRVEKKDDGEENVAEGPQMDPDMQRFFERFFGQPMPQQRGPMEHHPVRGEGSGFIVDANGTIVTNAHVAGGADKIEVIMQDGTKYDAKLKGVDEKTDIAVIKIEPKSPMPFVTFGDSSKVRVGDRVVAVGNPFGLGGTVTSGIVSATGREIGSGPYDDFLQIDAPINRGNSGGPAFNLDGEVIGINSAIFSPSGGSVGIGFAISSNLAKQVVADLSDDGKVDRSWLGVNIQGVDEDLAAGLGLPKAEGALVAGVEDGSPAAKAGVKQGDVIVGFDGHEIDKVGQLPRLVATTKAGTSTSLTVLRDGKEVKLTAVVEEMPNQDQVASAEQPTEPQPRLGLSLAPITPETRSQLKLDGDQNGVVVAEVVPGSPAEAKGIAAGDVLVSVDGKAVSQPKDVVEAVKTAQGEGKKAVVVVLVREGKERYEAIPFAVS
ncbi:MAG: DegQ family serine endoprotease [Geminicoccaceae bacterium]